VDATGWAAPVAAGLLLVAGLPRLVWGSPAQRALAAALCCSAGVLVVELDAVQDLLARLGLVPLGALVQCLATTGAAAAAYAVARQVAPQAQRPRPSPAVAALPVALLQCVLFAASGAADRPPTGTLFLDGFDRPAVMLLWAVTAAAAGAAGAVLLPLLRRHGPALPRLRSRIAVACTFAGAVVVGFAGIAMGAQLVLRAAGWPGAARLVAGATPLAPAGLALVAVGVLAVRAAAALDPARRWYRAHRALGELAGLAGELRTATPEWAATSVADRWSVRDPSGRLYRRVIGIRDASTTLLGALDGDAPLERAAAFARARCGPGPAAAALAEACWLREALRRRAAAQRPADPRPAQFPARAAEPPGSLDDEAAFLVAVARAWSSPLVAEFLAGTGDHAASPNTWDLSAWAAGDAGRAIAR
jgi:hypothetical protein